MISNFGIRMKTTKIISIVIACLLFFLPHITAKAVDANYSVSLYNLVYQDFEIDTAEYYPSFNDITPITIDLRSFLFDKKKEDHNHAPYATDETRKLETIRKQKELEKLEVLQVNTIVTEEQGEIPEIYLKYINELKEKHPNWIFKFYDTGLSWNEAVKNESVCGRNAITYAAPESYRSISDNYEQTVSTITGYVPFDVVRQKTETGEYIIYTNSPTVTVTDGPSQYGAGIDAIQNSTVIRVDGIVRDNFEDEKYWCKISYDVVTGSYIPVEGARWYQPNSQVIQYYMDPRNFMSESSIFQFETLSYNANTISIENINKMIQGSFMENAVITDNDGNEITYAEAILDAANRFNISPYHIISRIFQEVGRNITTASGGTSSKYPGIYNFYNIGANTGVTDGLAWASSGDTYMRPWDTQYKSLVGGAQFLAEGYINNGQDTLYFQKFNVLNNSGRFGHQYMSNIDAPNAESKSTFRLYQNESILDSNFTFIIPIYSDMPINPVQLPI